MIVRDNLPDFKAGLDARGQKLAKRTVRKGVAAAARAMAKAIRPTVPVGQSRKGHLAGTIRRAVYGGKTKLTKGGAIGFVSIYKGKKYAKRNRDAFYWPWVEAGHVARGPGKRLRGGDRNKKLQRDRIRSSGKGFVPGLFFFRAGFRASQGAALDAFSDALNRDLNEG